MDIVENALKDFGGLIGQLRSQKGWSLEELGQRSGCSSSFVFRVENKVRKPSLETKLDMLIALDIPQEIVMVYVHKVVEMKRKSVLNI